MTKKHFIALADAIRDHNKYGPAPFTQEQIGALASFCRDQNNNFLAQRWVDYITGECGPGGGAIKPEKVEA